MAKPVGKVKWFDNAKGFGFIVNEEGEDVFVHFGSILGEGFKTLKEDEVVKFVQIRSEKGWQAAEVERITDDASDVTQSEDQEHPDDE